MAAERPVQPIIGEAPVFLEMLEHVSRAAPLSKPVLVVGERGTGKELVASRLHYLSHRWESSVVKVNCAALTETILESELFGHEAGAFTGAVKTHVGHFERADGGTLILDELATISLRMQEKILRVIEYGEIQRVGGSETLQVDVRIVGSTNADLRQLAAEGSFRQDLLDRLAFDVITVPPLRERLEDILPLAYAFAINMASELKRELFAGFGPRASSSLLQHDWPGNVRELKNLVQRLLILGQEKEIGANEIEATLTSFAAQASAPSDIGLPLDLPLREAREQFERVYLQHQLRECEGNVSRLAERVGMERTHLYRKLRALGIETKRAGK